MRIKVGRVTIIGARFLGIGISHGRRSCTDSMQIHLPGLLIDVLIRSCGSTLHRNAHVRQDGCEHWGYDKDKQKDFLV